MIQFAFCVFVLIFLFVMMQKLQTKLNKYPPGPIRWPIIGSLPQILMIDRTYSYKQMAELSRQYGPIMSVGLGMVFTVIVNSCEIMKDLFKRPETSQHRFLTETLIQRSNGENLGVIWSNEGTWKEMRKITVKALRDFGFGKARSAEVAYKEEADALLEDIREEVSKTDGVWEVDPDRLSVVTINILWSSVGGYRFDHHGDIIKEHIGLNVEIFNSWNPSSLLTAFPFLKYFPELSGFNRNCKIHERVRAFMKELIENAKERRHGRVEPESFVEYFLDEMDKNKGDPNTVITEKQLVMILMDLFFGGTHTTSTLLHWLFLYFVLYPTVQTKARDEMRKASKDWTKPIPVAQSSRFPYLRACIYETMRHSPYVSFTVPRTVKCDVECAGYIIPSGSCLHFNLYPVFHDQEFWGDDVEEYIPERFLSADETKIIPRKLEQMPQFGFGSRICPGEALALNTTAAVAVAVLSTYEIGVVPGREPKLEPDYPSLAIGPKPYVVQIKPIVH